MSATDHNIRSSTYPHGTHGGGSGVPGGRRMRRELEIDLSAPSRVRSLVERVAADTPVTEDALLLASEITTNAILHGSWAPGDKLRLVAQRHHRRLRISVSGPGEPFEPERSSSDRPGGFGLKLLDSLSSAWAVEPENDHAVRVWFELTW